MLDEIGVRDVAPGQQDTSHKLEEVGPDILGESAGVPKVDEGDV